ncbi:hypothetical protein PMAYCL1PPCAC_24816, partial [Pristionchus mayeri]
LSSAEMKFAPNLAMFVEMRRMDVRQVIYQFLNLAMDSSSSRARVHPSQWSSRDPWDQPSSVLPSLVVNTPSIVHIGRIPLSSSHLSTGYCGLSNE